VVADVTHPLIGIDFLSHFGLLVDCKHNRLLGRHSRFIPISRGTRTASTVSPRPTSEVPDPHQPGERNHPSTQDHLPRLQSLRLGFSPAGRTNNLPTELPSSQDRQSARPFSGHSELLQTISTPSGGTPVTTSRRSLLPQSQGLLPHHLDAGNPQGLRREQGEFVTRHSTGAPRHIHATCTRHRRLHGRPLCHATGTRPERLAAPHLLPQENQPRGETYSYTINTTTTTFNPAADATPAAAQHAAPPPPVARNTRSRCNVRFTARFNS
jgi:hypothetical protein